MRLNDIVVILGCDKGTASKLRSGNYDRPTSDLLKRYHALVSLIEQERMDAKGDVDAICHKCDRNDCTGCRLAEI
ncbi:MAG: hypothetical protein PHC35_01785 [Deltaproteobacteria bacterium]|nr:hypothetical protein [Deltaproteobacteria bacterium]